MFRPSGVVWSAYGGGGVGAGRGGWEAAVVELVAGNSMNVAHLPFPPRMYVAIFLSPALPYSSAIAALAPCRILEGAPEWTVALARRCSAAMRPANSSRACSRGCTWPHELKMRRPERRPADRRACHLPVRRLALHCAVVRPPPRVAARGRRLRLTLSNTAHFQLVGQHGCARACGGNGEWGVGGGVGVAHGQRHHHADLQGVGSGGHGAARSALNRRTAPIRGMRIDRRRASVP